MAESAPELAIFAAVVVGVVQILKEAFLPSRWAGVAAVVVGLVLAVAPRTPIVGWDLGNWFAGLVAGLMAAGAYGGVKALGGAKALGR